MASAPWAWRQRPHGPGCPAALHALPYGPGQRGFQRSASSAWSSPGSAHKHHRHSSPRLLASPAGSSRKGCSRSLGFPPDLTTVARLGTCLTEFSTSSSVTSIRTQQRSSSGGRGSAPCLVTQGWTCGAQQEVVVLLGAASQDAATEGEDHLHLGDGDSPLWLLLQHSQ